MSEQTQEQFDFSEFIDKELTDINWNDERIEYIGDEVYLIPIDYLDQTIYVQFNTKGE